MTFLTQNASSDRIILLKTVIIVWKKIHFSVSKHKIYKKHKGKFRYLWHIMTKLSFFRKICVVYKTVLIINYQYVKLSFLSFFLNSLKFTLALKGWSQWDRILCFPFLCEICLFFLKKNENTFVNILENYGFKSFLYVSV